METPKERLKRKGLKLRKLNEQIPARTKKQKGIKLTLTHHAKERMLERQISITEVVEALRSKISRSFQEAPWVASLGTLRVLFEAVNSTDRRVKVVTVFHQTI